MIMLLVIIIILTYYHVMFSESYENISMFYFKTSFIILYWDTIFMTFQYFKL